MGQLHLKIFGTVQGVFFRAKACEKAQSLGLKGWVKNCSDGSVEALAQGFEENLQKFLVWCYDGPSGAKIIDIKATWQEPEEKFDAFEIR